MKSRKLVLAGIAIVALSTAGAIVIRREPPTSYRTVALERGTIESVVTSTGQLQAIETVEVGTQVSGQIAELLVDFNDRVKKGQLLARIDPAILLAEVRSAEATVQRNRAELDQAKKTLARSDELYTQKVVTESEHESAVYSASVAAASYSAAEIGLERAQRNLGYTEVRAPIDGVVVERTVESGQTVAASMSAPKLFVIARDLTRLEILASVDESDIGKIHEGQQARFTVQAFGDRQFHGTVRQVRLQATTADNVVSYTVVVEVDNPDGALLPGMTATAEFVIQSEAAVLRVPNSALRFRPAGATTAAAGQPGARAAGGQGRPSGGTLYRLDADGAPEAVRVQVGLTDGQYTAVSGEELEQGTEVITGTSTSAQGATAAANPFQQQAQGPGGPRPGGF